MKRFFPFTFLLIIACSDEPKPEAMPAVEAPFRGFTTLSSSQTGIDFLNQIEENEFVNHLVWDACYYGGGVGIGDVNNDGFQDVFFTGNQVSDRLYLGDGDWNFEDLEEEEEIKDKSFSNLPFPFLAKGL